MSRHRTRALQRLAPLFAATLVACGGGGGGGSPPPPPPPPPPPAAAAELEGTAAVGAALANANVSITDTSGAPVCTQASITTNGTGDYSCTLQPNKSAPFIVVVTDPSGAHPPLVSIGTQTPAPNAPLTLNATPLTTALVGQLSGDGNALTVVNSPSLIDAAALADVTSKVLAQIAGVLAAVQAPAGYDPFTTPIVAATNDVSGNTADRVVDLLRITSVDGVNTIATFDNPSAAVPLATPSSANAPPLPAPSANFTEIAEALRIAASALNSCFALPVATRVVSKNDAIPLNQGGPQVTEVDPECEDIAHANYLHHGYRAGQGPFYALLNDEAMVGATFRVPEVMVYLPDANPAGNHRVVVNLRYTDKNGVVGNVITVGIKLPGSESAERRTDWWLWGNQRPVFLSMQPFVRRTEQYSSDPNFGTSRYESGLVVYVNKDGPGSSGLRAARVTGPGLPPAGLVLTRPDPSICTDQDWLNIRRKDGLTDPASASFAGNEGNILRLQRTVGLSGAEATTLRPVPNAGNSNSTQFVSWAHPLDYGAPLGSLNFVDYAALSANAAYSFELFYDNETAPRHTLQTLSLQPVIPATRGALLPWVDLSAATKAYLDPANALAGEQAQINLAWDANPLAETIASTGVYSGGGGALVNQGRTFVPRGATSVVAVAPGVSGACDAGTNFRGFTADDGFRALQLRYRMLDGSYKDGFWRYK